MAFLFAACVALLAFFGTNTYAITDRATDLGDSMFGSNGLDYGNNQLLTNQQVYAQPAVGGQTFMPAQNSQSFGNTMTFGQQAQTGSMFGQNSQSFGNTMTFGQQAQPGSMFGQNSQSFGNTMTFGQQAQPGSMFGQRSSSPMIAPQSAGFGSPVMLAPQYGSQNAGLFAGNTNSLSSLLPIFLLSGSSSSFLPLLLLG